MADDFFRHASHQNMTQAAASVRAHDDEVRPKIQRRFDDFRCRRSVAQFDAKTLVYHIVIEQHPCNGGLDALLHLRTGGLDLLCFGGRFIMLNDMHHHNLGAEVFCDVFSILECGD